MPRVLPPLSLVYLYEEFMIPHGSRPPFSAKLALWLIVEAVMAIDALC
jgi:hypothetical protein